MPKSIFEKEFRPVTVVTENMQRAAFKQVRLMRGNVRLTLGRLSTNEEIEARRRRARNLPIL